MNDVEMSKSGVLHGPASGRANDENVVPGIHEESVRSAGAEESSILRDHLRRPYSAPGVVDYGDARSLTQSGSRPVKESATIKEGLP